MAAVRCSPSFWARQAEVGIVKDVVKREMVGVLIGTGIVLTGTGIVMAGLIFLAWRLPLTIEWGSLYVPPG